MKFKLELETDNEDEFKEIIAVIDKYKNIRKIDSQVLRSPQPVGNTHAKTGTTPDTHSQIKSIMDDSFKEKK